MSVEYPSADVGHILLVIVTVLHLIAIIITCLRLWIRVRWHQLWWEDAWASLALFFDIICAISTWILNLPERDHPLYMSEKSHIASLWLSLLSQTCLIWATRMSIVFSLLRMITPSSRMRKIVNGSVAFFFLMWALCGATKVYACSSDRTNSHRPIVRSIAGIEFTANVISDVVLIALPTPIMWKMRLHRNERILALSIFWMSLLSVTVSIVHVAFFIPIPRSMASMTADTEGALDLVFCNLLVLVTTAYRFFRNGVGVESTGDGVGAKPTVSAPLQVPMDTLTTVDLECLETISIHTTQSAPMPQSETTCVHPPSPQPSSHATL